MYSIPYSVNSFNRTVPVLFLFLSSIAVLALTNVLYIDAKSSPVDFACCLESDFFMPPLLNGLDV